MAATPLAVMHSAQGQTSSVPSNPELAHSIPLTLGWPSFLTIESTVGNQIPEVDVQPWADALPSPPASLPLSKVLNSQGSSQAVC